MSWASHLLYRALIYTAPLARWPLAEGVWDRAWASAGRRLSGSIRLSIHGHKVLVNTGYAYPAFVRRWPTYNDPLVELVHQVNVVKDAPVHLVDVGAAVGDTVLLVHDRCPGAVATFHCVEGDAEFFHYLSQNLATLPGANVYYAMLSDEVGHERELVRTHLGTASAQGVVSRAAITLDSLLLNVGQIDIVKIDTDGFDGKVLAGARRVLREQQPAVIFEWHPQLCQATGQDHSRPFHVLAEAGYRSFVWFDKYGVFSHVDVGYHAEAVEVLAQLCLSGGGPAPDWHYDVVALPHGSHIEPVKLATLAHARTHRARPGGGVRMIESMRGWPSPDRDRRHRRTRTDTSQERAAKERSGSTT